MGAPLVSPPTESIRRSLQFLLELYNLFDLNQEPAVNLGQLEDFLNRESGAEGVADEEMRCVGHAQFAADDVAREDFAVAIDFRADTPGIAVAALAAAATRARSPCLRRAQAFCRLSLNVRTMAIASPTLCICAVSLGGWPEEISRRQSAESW